MEENEIGKVEKKEYEKLKRRALKFERRNYGFVLVIPCDGEHGWCEMGENSALIYKYQVCMKLGALVTMTDDADSFYIRYEVGRVRTRGFDTVRRRLKRAGLYKAEVKKDKCVIFQLKQPFTKSELEKMRSDEEERQVAMNSIVKVNFSDPVLYQKMIEVATRLHRICYRRMDKVSSATNGVRIVEKADGLILKYYEMAERKVDYEKRMKDWQELWEGAHRLLIELQIVAGLKLWTREACVKIGEEVAEMQHRIEQDMVREEAKRSNQGKKSKEEAKGGKK